MIDYDLLVSALTDLDRDEIRHVWRYVAHRFARQRMGRYDVTIACGALVRLRRAQRETLINYLCAFFLPHEEGHEQTERFERMEGRTAKDVGADILRKEHSSHRG